MINYQKIKDIISQHGIATSNIVTGDAVKPLHIIGFTGFFKNLDLNKEELLLVSYAPDSETPKFILTDHNLYYSKSKKPASVTLGNYSEKVLKGIGESEEIEAVGEVISYIVNRRSEAKKTLNSFVEKYKQLAESEKKNYSNKELFFDGNYLALLLQESEEAIQMCLSLNQDAHFIQSLNLVFSKSDKAIDGIKSEHLLLADLIHAYKLIVKQANEKAMFTMAYFFERLQGNNFAAGISIQRLNEMVTKEKFRANIEKIKDADFINAKPEYADEFILPSILYRMDHLQFMKSGNLLYRFASLLAKADNTVSEEEKEILKQILEKTTKPKTKPEYAASKEIPKDDSLEKVMLELNNLIGLEEVKKGISDLINLMKIEKIRKDKDLENVGISLHSVFLGPPGTGKTTVARLLGRIFKHLGYLKKGHLVETDRAGLVAGYVGQTAIRVNDVVNESVDGVLFIDEAYSLAVEDGGRDFGQEAVDALVKRMEDLRNQLVVIVAGYTEPLKFFIESNPGLRSRFSRYYKFEHFYPQQLLAIMQSYCKSADFTLTEAATGKLLDMFEMMYEKRDDNFGNARVVRNVFERCVQNQANRLVNIPELTVHLLQTIEEQDINEPKYMVDQVFFTKSEK
jgi:stage V sporulation protein K